MPLQGLPSTLETILHSLLQENSLTSYKIEAGGTRTVVVLRLSTNQHGESTGQTSSTTFRKKCPSQIARDKKRAEAYRNEQEKQASGEISAPSDLFLPTPPSLFYETDFPSHRPNSAFGHADNTTDNTPCGSDQAARASRDESTQECATEVGLHAKHPATRNYSKTTATSGSGQSTVSKCARDNRPTASSHDNTLAESADHVNKATGNNISSSDDRWNRQNDSFERAAYRTLQTLERLSAQSKTPRGHDQPP